MVIRIVSIIIGIVSIFQDGHHEGLNGVYGCQQCQDGQLNEQDGSNDSYYDHQNGQDGHPNNQAGCKDNQDYLQYW